MSARKKQWSKPQLIVLGRGTPEENVLKNCKAGNAVGPTGAGCTALGINCASTNRS